MRKKSGWMSFVAAALLSLTACGGGHRAGDSCNSGYDCQDSKTFLECAGGIWVGSPCRGPGGCSVSATTATCDYQGAQAGDHCPTFSDNKYVCSGPNVMQCTSSAWTVASSCPTGQSCAIANDTTTCQ